MTSTHRPARPRRHHAIAIAIAIATAFSALCSSGGAFAQSSGLLPLSEAASVSQLRTTEESLNTRIDDVSRRSYGGIAAALAVQMPGSHVPGKTVMRVGSAVFRGESAIGVSFRRTAENNGWSITGGVGISRAGAAATVGAEWVFN